MSSTLILTFLLGLWVGTVAALIIFILLSKEYTPHDKQ